MRTFQIPCGCRVERERPDRLFRLCPPCAAEFTEKHARALADYRRKYVVPQPARPVSA